MKANERYDKADKTRQGKKNRAAGTRQDPDN
jgi:hypothetical protein